MTEKNRAARRAGGPASHAPPRRVRDRSAEARKRGGNPDKKPAANAGNVGLGGTDGSKPARKSGPAN